MKLSDTCLYFIRNKGDQNMYIRLSKTNLKDKLKFLLTYVSRIKHFLCFSIYVINKMICKHTLEILKIILSSVYLNSIYFQTFEMVLVMTY